MRYHLIYRASLLGILTALKNTEKPNQNVCLHFKFLSSVLKSLYLTRLFFRLEDITGLTGLKLVQLLSRTHRQSKSETGLSKLQTLANEAQFLIINKSSCEALQVS